MTSYDYLIYVFTARWPPAHASCNQITNACLTAPLESKLSETLLPLIKSALYISALILTLDLEGPLRGCLSSNSELILQIQLLQWPTYESLIESCV